MVSSPANSPCDPALGCSEQAREAGDLAEVRFEPLEELGVARRLVARRERDGSPPNAGQLTGIISVVALSFMVHEPSGIIAAVSERSLFSSDLR